MWFESRLAHVNTGCAPHYPCFTYVCVQKGLATREQAYAAQQRQQPTSRPAALSSQLAQAMPAGVMQGLTDFSQTFLTDAAAFVHTHVLPVIQEFVPPSSPSSSQRPGINPQHPAHILSQASSAIGRPTSGVQQRQQPQPHVELPASFLFLSQTTWMALGLLIYILSPLDLIPDFLPVVGWLDDAVALFYFVKLVLSQLSR